MAIKNVLIISVNFDQVTVSIVSKQGSVKYESVGTLSVITEDNIDYIDPLELIFRSGLVLIMS